MLPGLCLHGVIVKFYYGLILSLLSDLLVYILCLLEGQSGRKNIYVSVSTLLARLGSWVPIEAIWRRHTKEERQLVPEKQKESRLSRKQNGGR